MKTKINTPVFFFKGGGLGLFFGGGNHQKRHKLGREKGVPTTSRDCYLRALILGVMGAEMAFPL